MVLCGIPNLQYLPRLILYLRAILVIAILFVSSSVFSQDSTTTVYKFNGKVVKEELFKKQLAELEEIPGTWYCKKMVGGGATGYECKDKYGKIFAYACIVTDKRNECYLEIQSGGMPMDY